MGLQLVSRAAADGKRPVSKTSRTSELFANPRRPAAWAAGGRNQLQETGIELPEDATMARYFTVDYGLVREDASTRQEFLALSGRTGA